MEDKTAAKSRQAILLSFLLLVLLFLLSTGIGKVPLSPGDILNILLGRCEDTLAVSVFFRLRLPRTLMAALAGIGLGMAGNVFQTLFKNPLASPDVIGVTSGASAGAAASIVFFSGGVFSVPFGAFIGAMMAVFFVIGLVKLTGARDAQTYVLSGIVVNALLSGFIMLLKVFSDPENELGAIEFWTMGSFGSITSQKLFMILPFFVVGLMGVFLLRWTIHLLSLSDEEGKALGLSVERSRFFALLFSTLMVASIVSVTGLISFSALIPPHLARSILKRNDFMTSLFSGILGALLMILSDCVVRSLFYAELPISIITSFIGAPYLALLVCRKNFTG